MSLIIVATPPPPSLILDGLRDDGMGNGAETCYGA